MKTELKFVSEGHIDDGLILVCSEIDQGFCKKDLSEYVDFGDVDTVFFVFSSDKPGHRQYFVLEYGRIGNARKVLYGLLRTHCWWVNTLPSPESPWEDGFDEYLTDKFGTDKPVYAWVEYK